MNPAINYQRIATAIEYIQNHQQSQPSLEEIAEVVHLSPAHFQRLFTDFAGTSPKKFLQYISLSHAKSLLKEQQKTLFDVTHETGLSSSSRLHDLFIHIEGMTPAEYKNGGKQLAIHYDFTTSIFGNVIIASTSKGICHLAFYDNKPLALEELQDKFPNATFSLQSDTIQQSALAIFNNNPSDIRRIKLHLRGTDFQLKVWEALLSIPPGKLLSYGDIATEIKQPKSARAVGSAIGANPIAFLIPCHRVIQASGLIGGYRWGATRKSVMIGWESAQLK